MLYETKADLSGANFTGPLQHAGNNVWDAGNLIIEEGSFTPSIAGVSVGNGNTYSQQQGYYYRIGKQVFIYGRVTLTFYDIANMGSGIVNLKGLPFAATGNTVPGVLNLGLLRNVNFPEGLKAITGFFNANLPTATISGVASNSMEVHFMPYFTNSTAFVFSGTYRIA